MGKNKYVYPELESGSEGINKGLKATINKPQYLIVHHVGGTDLNPLADTSGQTFAVVNEYHRVKWNFKSSLGYYIGYHYFIDKKGKLTQGRADTDVGAHTVGKNEVSLGICLAGNFDATLPTPEQITTLKALLHSKLEQYNLPVTAIVPHRKFAIKSCYGNKLPDNWTADLMKDDVVSQLLELQNQETALLKKLQG